MYPPTIRLHHGVFMYKDDVVGGITARYSQVLIPNVSVAYAHFFG